VDGRDSVPILAIRNWPIPHDVAAEVEREQPNENVDFAPIDPTFPETTLKS
jgi:hypothetical protein